MPSAADILNNYIDSVAAEHQVKPELVHAVMRQESGGNQQAVSPKGAVGLMQLLPGTAKDLGVDPTVGDQNLRGGVAYLKQMSDRYQGDEGKTAAAYNAGPGNVDNGRAASFPETQAYVKATTGTAPSTSAADILNSYLASQQQQAPPKPSSQQSISAAPSTPQEDALTRFGKGVWQNVNPVAAVKGVISAVAHPKDTYNGMVNASADQFTKAMNAYNQQRYSEMAGHGAAAVLPLIGPPAANAGDKIAQGDVAGGLGEGVGQIASMLVPERAASAISDITKSAAVKLANSNLKPTATLKLANPTRPPALTTLKGGYNWTAGGAAKAAADVEGLTGNLSDLVNNPVNATKQLGLQPVLKHLNDLEAEYLHQPNAEADLAAVRNARKQLLDNPLYTKEVTQPTQVPTQVQVPHPSAVDAQGNPIMQTQTVMQPGPPEVVGRTLVPQSPAEIDRMKKNVYAGLKGKYGKEASGVIETDKAMGRGLKGILDDNVPGAKEINSQQADAIVARNTLDAAIRRQENHPSFGLMDMLQLGVTEGGIGAIPFGHPLAGAAGVGAGALMYAIRHPLPASYLAKGLYNTSKAAASPLVTAAAKTVMPGVQVENNKRPVTKTEATERYKVYLAAPDPQAGK